jgi:hypothetical protein
MLKGTENPRVGSSILSLGTNLKGFAVITVNPFLLGLPQ